jgi:hypothetical protein
MSRSDDLHDNPKISSGFASRLAAMRSDQWVRVILMPAPYLARSSGERPSAEERQTILRETRDRTAASFSEVDGVLAQTGGHRLTDAGNGLGFIVVETTVDGVAALSRLPWVGSLMEDQSVRPVERADPPDPVGGDCPDAVG